MNFNFNITVLSAIIWILLGIAAHRFWLIELKVLRLRAPKSYKDAQIKWFVFFAPLAFALASYNLIASIIRKGIIDAKKDKK